MRSAEKLLEFDRLKDIVSRYTTCAPGRRATLGLQIRQDAEALDAEFALVREAVEYLRGGSELGFGSLADPEAWLGSTGDSGARAFQRGTARCRFADGYVACGAADIQGRGGEISALAEAPLRLPICGIFRPRFAARCCRMAKSATTLRRN